MRESPQGEPRGWKSQIQLNTHMSPTLSPQQNWGPPVTARAPSCMHKQQLGNPSPVREGMASKISSILETLGILPQTKEKAGA